MPLPTGHVSFLITDIERSTEILQTVGDDVFAAAMERHNSIVHNAVEPAGTVVHVTGDSFFAVFTDPSEALSAAVTVQKELARETWPDNGEIKVRMGIHTGVGTLGGEDYVGLDVHRAARISSAAHGGQILVSGETARRLGERLPSGVELEDLGRHLLKDLSRPEELYQAVIPGLPSEFAEIQGAARSRGNIPALATTFVGRGSQVADVVEMLNHHRLVTLTGPGGTGKTRLSIQVAEGCQERFADGAFFIDLETIVDQSLIPTAALKALQPPPSPRLEPIEQLVTYLEGKNTLLVLDNYEQLLPQVDVVSRLLDEASGVRLIVTSRAPLHLRGEREYPVPPLPTPDDVTQDPSVLLDYESVQLFVNRATMVRPDFQITADNGAAVASLAKQLDGLPLAIELAASRVRVLTPQEILDRLSNRLLSNTSADLPHRQQTIANAVEWSYDLLDEPGARFFERMSVFEGGAALPEIERVCDPDEELGADALEILSGLVEHSLVDADPGLWGTRYQMLVVVREFAAAKLEERDEGTEIRTRHMHTFADLGSRAEPYLLTSHQGKWLDVLAREHDNMRSSLNWAVSSGATDVAREMVGDLWRYWQRRGHIEEGLTSAGAALAMPDGVPMATARALEAQAGLYYWQGEWEEAVGPYLAALEICRDHGSPIDVANALFNASFAMNTSGERETAEAYLQESLKLSKSNDYQLGVGRALWGLCDINFLNNSLEAAVGYGKRAEHQFEGLDAPFDLGWARFMIAHVSFVLGDYVAARRYIDTALPLFVDPADISALLLVIYVKAGVASVEGDKKRAGMLIGGLDNIISVTGQGIGQIEANRYDQIWQLQESEDPEIQDAIAEGRLLSVEETIELAIDS